MRARDGRGSLNEHTTLPSDLWNPPPDVILSQLPDGALLVGELLTEEQTSVMLKKSVRTLKRWRQFQIGPVPKYIGRTCYYHVGSILAYIRATRPNPRRTSRRRR